MNKEQTTRLMPRLRGRALTRANRNHAPRRRLEHNLETYGVGLTAFAFFVRLIFR